MIKTINSLEIQINNSYINEKYYQIKKSVSLKKQKNRDIK